MSGSGVKFGRALADLLAHTMREHEATAEPQHIHRTVNGVREVFTQLGNAADEPIEQFAQELLDTPGMPESLKPMLRYVKDLGTELAGMGKQLFIWGILIQLVSQVLEPFIGEMQHALWSANATQLLPVLDAAQLEQRGYKSKLVMADEAGGSGFNAERFTAMTWAAGTPLTVAELLLAHHRKIITEDQLKAGLADAGIREEWIDPQIKMGVIIPTVQQVMVAWLEGQIEKPEAEKRYLEAGGDPTWFQTSYDSQGSAPSPVELGEMFHRGIIGEKGIGPKQTTFEQGFLEGPWRNKWMGPMLELSRYYIPPRSIVAMLKDSAITHKRALELLHQQGVTTQDAESFITEATHAKTTKQRELTEAQIKELYEAKAINEATAMQLWEALGYEKHEATFLLELAKMSRIVKFTTTAITTIHTEFTNHTITTEEAVAELDKLQVPAEQRNELLKLWEVEARARIKHLTEAQVIKAIKVGVLEVEAAEQKLLGMGYTQEDAQLLIRIEVGFQYNPITKQYEEVEKK